MHLSIETDYAIRCVMYLALNGGKAEFKKIGQQMRIYDFQLSAATKRLEKAGLVSTENGELCLLQNASCITLFDIATAVEGEFHINRCLEPDHFCSRDATDSCPVRLFYVGLQDTIMNRLRETTIATFVEQF